MKLNRDVKDALIGFIIIWVGVVLILLIGPKVVS